MRRLSTGWVLAGAVLAVSLASSGLTSAAPASATSVGRNQAGRSGDVATTTAVTSVTPAVAATGQLFTVGVSVTPASGTVAPDGQVAVSDGGTGSCTATLSAGTGSAAGTGIGSCQLSESAAGSYTLTASYAGQDMFDASSGTGSVTVDAAPAFVADSPPLTATAGQPYGYTFTASGAPAPAYALAGDSPSWLSIDPASGVLSGTVPAGTTSFSYAVTASNPVGTVTAGPFAVQLPGPFVTFLFSRSEMTAADNCAADNSGIAPLDTVVAPYLQARGMSATGTLETGNMQATTPLCVHYNESLGASWQDATQLADTFGWSFGSATATYPRNIGSLPPAEGYAQTCGSAAAIDAHGLPGGHGIIAYPGAQGLPTQLQATDGASCFAWGRDYGDGGLTPSSAGTTPPYWQHTGAVNGGSCHVKTASCYHVAPTQTGKLPRYVQPSVVIARIKALQPGQWLTVQAYVLVTGTNPSYASNQTRWDCTSANPNLHWTNDNERYCYRDWKKIVNAVGALPNVTVTDPLTVGEAFGRPSSYQSADQRPRHT